jgi:hypothetical protein
MIGGQNFRSAIMPELPYIPTVSQQLPYPALPMPSVPSANTVETVDISVSLRH